MWKVCMTAYISTGESYKPFSLFLLGSFYSFIDQKLDWMWIRVLMMLPAVSLHIVTCTLEKTVLAAIGAPQNA